MRSPEGEEFANAGCVLDVVEHEKFAWTGALAPGYRPRSRDEQDRFPFVFSAVITFEPGPDGTGTRHTALAIHADGAGADAHAKMGFHAGGGAAFDQLVALVRRTSGRPA